MLCQSPVVPLRTLQDCKQFYQFLDFCQQQSIETHHWKIASIALEIPAIDPLVVLETFALPDQLHFYFERRTDAWATAALDSAICFQTNDTERFANAQAFVQTCSAHLLFSRSLGAASVAWTTPCFFSSFTFFDQTEGSDAAPGDRCTEPASPFAAPFPAATLFLPQWQITRCHDQSVAIANVLIHEHSNLEHLTQTLWQQWQALSALPNTLDWLTPLPNLHPWKIIDTHDFRATVVTALDAIQQQQLDKLVLAHAIDVVSRLPFQQGQSLHQLRQLHPDCYVFSVGNGSGQSFIGASPERLLSVQNHQLATDALAGSAPRGDNKSDDDALAQQLLHDRKERHEHQVVVNFISQRLSQFGLTPEFAPVPSVLPLSNIQHLHTPIHATLPAQVHPLALLAELHPTPAVAGMPRTLACQHIRQYEPFARSLYAAPIGWIDSQGNAEFVVGIRSALIAGNHARLYAGAGIVAGSNPDRELAEIRLKLQALLRALI